MNRDIARVPFELSDATLRSEIAVCDASWPYGRAGGCGRPGGARTTSAGPILPGIIRVIFALSAFAWSVAARADDITLQVGTRFSVYAPSSCRRANPLHFSLVLECDFRGKAVRFYMKEFPAQLSDEFDPRKNPPSGLSKTAYLNSALRSIADELDPAMIPHLTILSSGSTHEDSDALFWEEGSVSSADAKNAENIDKCVFLRVQTYRRGLSAVLLAMGDGDRLVPENAWSMCRRMPREVMTILGSLGDIFEGGRFMWSRLSE